MSIYGKIDAAASKLEQVYPEELSERLRWWGQKLGIDQLRLLRMIGMSPQRAAQNKNKSLKTIIKDPHLAANAMGLEGRLHRLLSLFQYDWQALAHQVHASSAAAKANRPSRVAPMSKGGPQWISALLADLAESPADGGGAES
jgi:hypothetical protein